MKHHPIFERFSPYSGPVDVGYDTDFIGARGRHEFLPLPTTWAGRIDYPAFDEEYFEWIDILESVVSARGQYTMAELGAGYGRWSVRAALAMKQFSNLPTLLIAVEPEPVHFRWLKVHFADNGLDPEQHRLEQAAVGGESGEALFYVGMPEGGKDKPNEWYGQALTKSYEVTTNDSVSGYEGHQVVKHLSGWKSIKVPVRTLPELLEDVGAVDLVDFDLQGQEFKVIQSSINLLNEKVRRLHIGTHSHDLEDLLRELLRQSSWKCQADFRCLSDNDTPYGKVSFVDGVQSWVNPRLPWCP